MFQKLNSAIYPFAKRQETLFRCMEKSSIVIYWLDGAGEPFAEAMDILRAGIIPS